MVCGSEAVISQNLTQGVWFGPPAAAPSSETARTAAEGTTSYERAVAAVELLKLGDFSAKRQMLDVMEGAEGELRSSCCAVFCAVARHDEIALLMDVLDESDEGDVEMFALYGAHTLSLQAVPYLLALAETWAGTRLEEKLGDALQTLFPPGDDCGSTFEEIRGFYRDLAGRVDPALFYFWGKPAFAGDLTRKLITLAAGAKQRGESLQAFEVPMLLSIWSGVECPLSYTSRVDDTAMGKVLTYVKVIASMQWNRGVKYFYGRSVADVG